MTARKPPPLIATLHDVPEHVAAMIRPVIRKRIEWLETHAEWRAESDRHSYGSIDWQAAYRPFRSRLSALERELADAYCAHRWDVREWVLSHPLVARADPRPDAARFVVDGVMMEAGTRSGWEAFACLTGADLDGRRSPGNRKPGDVRIKTDIIEEPKS